MILPVGYEGNQSTSLKGNKGLNSRLHRRSGKFIKTNYLNKRLLTIFSISFEILRVTLICICILFYNILFFGIFILFELIQIFRDSKYVQSNKILNTATLNSSFQNIIVYSSYICFLY
uniref:Uncharacterized protein n=1 Tax=Heterorhabditis bacteriophora TaxID=37862 RepID=A0A1I7WTF3_HETBA